MKLAVNRVYTTCLVQKIWTAMKTRVSILIVFLTILTQLNGDGSGGGYPSRYGFPAGIMRRVGSAPRPLLSAPSSVLTDTVKTMNDKPRTAFSTSMGPSFRASDMDLDAFRRRAAELDSALDRMVGGLGELDRFGGFGGLGDPNPGKSRVSVPIMDGPLPETPSSSTRPDYPTRPIPGIPIARFPSGISRQPSIGSRVDESESPRISTPPAPEPSTVPDQTSGYRRGPRLDRSFTFAPRLGAEDSIPPPASPAPAPAPAPSTPDRPLFRSPTRPYTPPAAAESCASANPDAMPSISKYRRQPTRKAPLNDSDDSGKNADNVSPKEPEPYRPPSNTKKSPPSNPYRPSPTSGGTSPRTDQFNGSTVVSDKLPNNSGTIDIRISGRQIDDERMLQMIKEAKNAITVVFFAPAYETEYGGSISFSEGPSQMPTFPFAF